MCGLFGVYGKDISPALALELLNKQIHRGPDDFGFYQDSSVPLWLGHRRLSILDLSITGRQPMLSPSERYRVIFNGEIYNYIELRDELRSLGYSFNTGTDTEVLLSSVECWGLESAIRRFIGMFSFALYDHHTSSIHLVRDRIGIKPLFYSVNDNSISFASEITPLTHLPWIKLSISTSSLYRYFSCRSINHPHSIYTDIQRLPPASILTFNSHGIKLSSYWTNPGLLPVANRNTTASLTQVSEELNELLLDSVRLRLRSDAPFGTFLSGGIDSSLVTSIAQSLLSHPLKTFSVSFSSSDRDETEHAALVSKHLGTDHHSINFSRTDFIDTFERLIPGSQEPFADCSLLPTFYLASYAKQFVSVALSGDGGDELFGGYPRYHWLSRIQSLRQYFGETSIRGLGLFLSRTPPFFYDSILDTLTRKRFSRSSPLSDRIYRLAKYMQTDLESIGSDIFSIWNCQHPVLKYQPSSKYHSADSVLACSADRMMLSDQLDYLPSEILAKVDIASMQASLEARVPLLDHRLLEFSWSLPSDHLFDSNLSCGKLILRKVLSKYLPTTLFDRPKQGFGIPLAVWFRNEIHDWASEILHDISSSTNPYLQSSSVRSIWKEHNNGVDHSSMLWAIICFHSWYASRQ